MISSKNYLTARNVPFPPDKHAEINGKFVTLVSTFGEHWVAANKDHPLQQLWARDDGLAAVELVWLGDAIERMNAIDSRWTSREIKKIRGNDANNRSGALFEILGLSAFQGAAQTIRPMATGNPGYDGIITLTDTTEIQLSLKNYGTRSHEFDVRKHGRALEARAAEYLTANGLNGIGIRVMASAYPLTIGRWRAIEGGLGQAIIPALAQNAPVAIDDFWSLREFRLPNKFGPLARRYLSYTFMLTVPPIRTKPKASQASWTRPARISESKLRMPPSTRPALFWFAYRGRHPSICAVSGCETILCNPTSHWTALYFTNRWSCAIKRR